MLRGLLLTGGAPRYLSHEVSGGHGGTSKVSLEPLWWPPAKIVGRHLAPFLAGLAGTEPPEPATAPPGAVPVEVELRPEELARAGAGSGALAPAHEEANGDQKDRTVGEIMSSEVLVVAPEDTLGEIAEQMRERDVGSALGSDFGRLIGILTSRDLSRAFARRAHPSDARAREWMTTEPITVVATTPVTIALQLMTDHAIHHLPVVEGQRPVGRVGARQVAGAVAELTRTGRASARSLTRCWAGQSWPGSLPTSSWSSRGAHASFGEKSSSSRSIVVAVPMAISTSPGCRSVSPEGCGRSPPSDRRSAAMIAEPATSASGRPVAGAGRCHFDLLHTVLRCDVDDACDLRMQRQPRHLRTARLVRRDDSLRAGALELLLRLLPACARDDRQVGPELARGQGDEDVLGVGVDAGDQRPGPLDPGLPQKLLSAASPSM